MPMRLVTQTEHLHGLDWEVRAMPAYLSMWSDEGKRFGGYMSLLLDSDEAIAESVKVFREWLDGAAQFLPPAEAEFGHLLTRHAAHPDDVRTMADFVAHAYRNLAASRAA